MTDGQRNLTPKQDKALERIQLVGVVLIIGITITMKILAAADVIDLWKLLLVGFSLVIATPFILGVVVSRVEHRPCGEVIRDSMRSAGDDLRSAPARLRRWVADKFARLRNR